MRLPDDTWPSWRAKGSICTLDEQASTTNRPSHVDTPGISTDDATTVCQYDPITGYLAAAALADPPHFTGAETDEGVPPFTYDVF